MRKRTFKVGIGVSMTLVILLVVFMVVSLIVIDRGQTTIIGNLSTEEVKDIRCSVRNNAVSFPFHWLANGEFSAAWYYAKEAYTYRIVTIELIDTNMVFIYTTTNDTRTNIYPRGRLRPSFGANKTNGAWEVARNYPML